MRTTGAIAASLIMCAVLYAAITYTAPTHVSRKLQAPVMREQMLPGHPMQRHQKQYVDEIGRAYHEARRERDEGKKRNPEHMRMRGDVEGEGDEDEEGLYDDVPDGYVPIDVVGVIDMTTDSKVILCKIPFNEYSDNPSLTPMFADITKRYCPNGAVIKRRLSVLERMGQMLQPSGFIHHETRVGSTLASQLLASDPGNMVYPESPVPSKITHRCYNCTLQRKVHLTRVLFNAMGNSVVHKRVYMKFVPVMISQMDVLDEVGMGEPCWPCMQTQCN